MDRYTKWVISIFVVAFFIGCSQVKFNRDEDSFRCQNFTQNCVTENGIDKFDYTITIGKGLVDILFVDDNSGSMSTEQRGMAAAFSTFLNTISNLDYHIAITTTDMAGDGPLQNGRLLTFTSGLNILTNGIANATYLFQSTIQRQETLNCENSGFTNCPSGDERGIFAAATAVRRNENGFIRPNANLAVIILSDEDVRSTGFVNPTRGYEPTEDDRAESFMRLFDGTSAIFPGKIVKVHSIIVPPPPTGTSCKQIQDAQGSYLNAPGAINGQYGYEYARLAGMTNGIVGNICDGESINSPYSTPNYTAQVGAIGALTLEQIQSHKIACNPLDGTLIVTITGAPGVTSSFNSADNTVNFSSMLPSNTKVRFQYSCKSL